MFRPWSVHDRSCLIGASMPMICSVASLAPMRRCIATGATRQPLRRGSSPSSCYPCCWCCRMVAGAGRMDDVARRGDRGGPGMDGARSRHRPGHGIADGLSLMAPRRWLAPWAQLGRLDGFHRPVRRRLGAAVTVAAEGGTPALFDNIFQGFIGPMFLVAGSLHGHGQRS